MARQQTLAPFLEGLSRYGDRPAVLALRKEGADSWSYADLADRAGRLAGGLAEAGVAPGDRVAFLANNRPEWVAACLGAIRAGAVPVPLDLQFGDDVLAHVLRDSGARLLFTAADQHERLDRLGEPARLRRVLLDARDEEGGWGRLLAARGNEVPAFAPETEALLFYTSGTTGLPKGVPLSHGNLAFQLDALARSALVREDDRVLLPLPMHHVYPFVIGLLAPLAHGLPVTLPHSLTGPQMVRALREGEVTTVIGVPRLYSALYKGVQTRGTEAGVLARAGIALSTWLRRRVGLRVGKLLLGPLHQQLGPRLRVLVSGGAALDPELAWDLEGLGWQIATGYGLTETAPMLTLGAPGDFRIGSVGRPLPGVEVRIATAGMEESGEIQARGPGVFSGYLNLPEKTAEAFTEDGWFRTGDLGHFDADGYLYIDGRVATLIVTPGGEKTQPEQVEEAYQESPALSEVGVFQEEGRLVALIVPEAARAGRDGEAAREAVRAAVEERSRQLPSYQRITDFALTREELPRTHLGKIRRHELAERYRRARAGEEEPAAGQGPMAVEEMSAEDRALLEDDAAKKVWDWLGERFPGRRLTPDTSLRHDLGVDSLEWLNLTLEIRQRSGAELSEEAVTRIDTARELLAAVAEGGAGEGATGPLPDPLERPEEVLSDSQKAWLEPAGAVRLALGWPLAALVWAAMRGLFRLKVEGAEHLPERGPFVLAPNHASYLDAPALAAALGFHRLRQTFWGGSTDVVFTNPLTRTVSWLTQTVPVDPERAAGSSLALGAMVLKRGNVLVWFPEGQRSPTGELQPFRPGVGMLLDRFRVPVVPVSLHGTYEALPRGRYLPRLNTVRVVFGPALDPDDLERHGEGEKAAERITQALRDRLADLISRSSDAGAGSPPSAGPPRRGASVPAAPALASAHPP